MRDGRGDLDGEETCDADQESENTLSSTYQYEPHSQHPPERWKKVGETDGDSSTEKECPQRSRVVPHSHHHIRNDPRLSTQQHERRDHSSAEEVRVVNEIKSLSIDDRQRAFHHDSVDLHDAMKSAVWPWRGREGNHGGGDGRGNSQSDPDRRSVQILGRDSKEESQAYESDRSERRGRGMRLEKEPREEDGEGEDEPSGDLVKGSVHVLCNTFVSRDSAGKGSHSTNEGNKCSVARKKPRQY